MIWQWAAPAAGFFVTALAAHAVATRLGGRMDRVTRFVVVGGPIGLALAWVMATEFGAFSVQSICAILVYAAACELYLFLFTMTIGSISSNLLVRLSSGALTKTEIEARYDSRAMVEQRLERLVGTGFLTSNAGRFALTDKGERFVASMRKLRALFRHA
jgi:predicted transcriptional regulator